ncbi:MAG: tRNA nucleotidyltransferase [Ghiorsea sp.]
MPKLYSDTIPDALLQVCEKIIQVGGQAWLVGGCVRDLLLSKPPHDWDVEVYGLPLDALQHTLEKLGHCTFVGKQFGVFKLRRNSLTIDIALPRTEIKVGAGHKSFAVTPDPFINPEQAVLRRDFTINAMMFDPLSETLLDFHHGYDDLLAKKLQHVSPAFAEDPLRPLRAMQFAARFRCTLAADTAALCQTLKAEYPSLPLSRIWQEWKKWAMADDPSFGLQALRDMGWLDVYPELLSLIGCPQDAYWHPEGDVWVHTCLVVDAAAGLKAERSLSEQEQLWLVFAALCHDLGKPEVTFEDVSGKIHSPKHDHIGKGLAASFLASIAAPKSIKPIILPLVQEHMAHLYGDMSVKAVSRLAYRLSPASIELWEVLTEADASGRAPAPASRPALPWLQCAKELKVQHEKPRAIVTGKLLMAWGTLPTPAMGKALKKAYQAQLDGCFADEMSGKSWLEKNNLVFWGK